MRVRPLQLDCLVLRERALCTDNNGRRRENRGRAWLLLGGRRDRPRVAVNAMQGRQLVYIRDDRNKLSYHYALPRKILQPGSVHQPTTRISKFQSEYFGLKYEPHLVENDMVWFPVKGPGERAGLSYAPYDVGADLPSVSDQATLKMWKTYYWTR